MTNNEGNGIMNHFLVAYLVTLLAEVIQLFSISPYVFLAPPAFIRSLTLALEGTLAPTGFQLLLMFEAGVMTQS